MPFITIAESPDLPQSRPRADGSVPNWVTAFGHRPKLLDAWTVLLGVIKVRMQPRRYELATLAAALALRSSYCALAHGSVLRAHFSDADLERIVREGAFEEADRAVIDYARAIASDAASVDLEMIVRLKALGMDDGEICDIAATVSARCFFGKYLDALGIQADSGFASLPEVLRDALTPGRPISD